MTPRDAGVAAAVFAAVTDVDDHDTWSSIIGSTGVSIWPDGLDIPHRRRGELGSMWRWRYADPSHAAETLETLGLAPPPDDVRSWPCATCRMLCGLTVPRMHVTCSECGGSGRARSAPDVESLVRVALVGVGPWLRAEHLARNLSAASILWCAAPRVELERHHLRMSRRGVASEWSLSAFFSRHLASAGDLPPELPPELPERPPRRRRLGRSAAAGMLGDGVWSSKDGERAEAFASSSFARAAAAWPSMVELARCGVHLVGDDGWWDGETPWVALCPAPAP